ncbi:MAG: type I restriction-modification enzyme R subunit C-terminal domain-containing protein [Acidimicrobiales bacterium]
MKTPWPEVALGEVALIERRVRAPEDIRSGSLYVGLEDGSFGLFIRRLVGLDRAAAKEAFAEFLDDKRLGANQIEFVNLVIDELSDNGVIEPVVSASRLSPTSAPRSGCPVRVNGH